MSGPAPLTDKKRKAEELASTRIFGDGCKGSKRRWPTLNIDDFLIQNMFLYLKPGNACYKWYIINASVIWLKKYLYSLDKIAPGVALASFQVMPGSCTTEELLYLPKDGHLVHLSRTPDLLQVLLQICLFAKQPLYH